MTVEEQVEEQVDDTVFLKHNKLDTGYVRTYMGQNFDGSKF